MNKRLYLKLVNSIVAIENIIWIRRVERSQLLPVADDIFSRTTNNLINFMLRSK